MNPTRTTAIPRSGNNFYDILPLPPAFSVFSSLLPVCSIDLGMGDDVEVPFRMEHSAIPYSHHLDQF